MKKTIIYCRKSSESEDRQILSIQSQVDELKLLAGKLNITEYEVIQEEQSAKAPGRPRFNEIVQRIENGEVKTLLCWSLDRLSRNPIDGGKIMWLLQKKVIDCIHTPQRSYYPEDNALIMSVELGNANQFILDLSKNTKRGMLAKVKSSWLPGPAPHGYLNNKYAEKGEKTIYKDPERFLIIRKAWELLLTGNYTVPQILLKLNNKYAFRTVKRKRSGGKPLSRSGLYKIFSNPFYTGFIQFNGELYPGKQDPMITQDEFERAQVLLGRKSLPRPQKHTFAFTGELISCAECGCAVTAEIRKKYYPKTNNHAVYIYYHCTKKKGPCSQSSIRKEALEKQIVEQLSKIEISERFREWAISKLKKYSEEEIVTRKIVQSNLEDEHRLLQTKIDTLLDLRLEGSVDGNEYERKKKLLIQEKNKLRQKLNQSDLRADNWMNTAGLTFDFACNARKQFENGTNEEKRAILRALGSNFLLRDKKLLIDQLKPYLIIKNGIADSPNIAVTLEPPQTTKIKRENHLSVVPNPIWLRGVDSNHQPNG